MDFNKLCFSINITAKEAMGHINDIAIPNMALFIVDVTHTLMGSVSDGDIRRGLLNGLNLNDPILKFMNVNAKHFMLGDDNYDKAKLFKTQGIRFIPLIDSTDRIINLIDLDQHKSLIPADAIIMAGGIGSRLKPLTDNTPKPMLLVGDKPIIIRNIDRLKEFGIDDIYITVRYLKEKLISGLSDIVNIDKFISEDKPLGTIGAVKLIPKLMNDNIILMNSDILTNIDFEDFYNNYRETNADIQIATIPYSVTIPYGVVEIDHSNSVTSLKEKPKYTYYTNAGIYIFKKKMLDHIPADQKFDATDLIDLAIKLGHKVTSYPLYCYWLDIGRHEDYYKAQEDVKHIDF